VAPAACGSHVALATTVLDTLDSSIMPPSFLAEPLGNVARVLSTSQKKGIALAKSLTVSILKTAFLHFSGEANVRA
jgi:hypothetical protein